MGSDSFLIAERDMREKDRCVEEFKVEELNS